MKRPILAFIMSLLLVCRRRMLLLHKMLKARSQKLLPYLSDHVTAFSQAGTSSLLENDC